MPDRIENIYKEMLKLYDNSRVVRSAHFIAAQRKRWMHRLLGVGVIVLNIMIFSPLFDLVVPKHSAIIIKFLAIISASFAGIQTLFNFQKDIESHLNAGETYANINRKCGILLAEYKDSTKDAGDIIKEFKELIEKYLQANKDNKVCIPSDREYDKAREQIQGRDDAKKEVVSSEKA
jgi:hypothetical protein